MRAAQPHYSLPITTQRIPRKGAKVERKRTVTRMTLLTTISNYYHDYLPHYELSLFERLLLIWAFIACGFVIVLQLAQSWADPQPRWTVLDERTK